MTAELDRELEKIQESAIEEARKIYSKKVIDRWFNPRNMGEIENPEGLDETTGSCGDTMQISLRIKDGKITDARFITDGCGTSLAAGSMATELAIGKDVGEAFKISQDSILQGLDGLPEDSVHCALLASNTLKGALGDYLEFKREPWKKTYQRR